MDLNGHSELFLLSLMALVPTQREGYLFCFD
jgi:hypothetical protein